MAQVQAQERANEQANDAPTSASIRRGRIVRRYFLVFVTLVGGSLIAGILLEMGFRFQETRQSLELAHRQMAELAALRIQNYVEGVAQAIRLAAEPRNVVQGRIADDYIADLRDLLRNVPAVRDVVALDTEGREVLRASRIGRSTPDTSADHSAADYFTAARKGGIYFGPVIFPPDSFEPRIIVSVPIEPFRGEVIGVLATEVNVRYVWDVVQAIRVGETGYAYVVSATGQLVAHPDLQLVLQHKDFSDLPQVAALRDSGEEAATYGVSKNFGGQRVLVSHARIPSVGWSVLVERPLTEAYGPLLDSLARTGAILLMVCIMAVGAAVLLGRRVVRPIEVLRGGAARLEAGDLEARLDLATGDEFEELADDFNRMARRLEDAHSTLERKVEQRTHQLALANQAKSRFLAAASHDLRQPLHALGLFIAQLRVRMSSRERRHVIECIDAAVAAMNELFNALLDISKLDAGATTPKLTEFPVATLLKRVESTFARAAQEKSLSLRVVSSSAWIRSDFLLLERIVFNLVSNAIRYTKHGGLLVACRRRGAGLRIEVWDTGVGIAPDQHQVIFDEFYRLGEPDADRKAGLGLGLAIVDRLCRLLDHPLALTSAVGRGSRFSVTVPIVAARAEVAETRVAVRAPLDNSLGKLVVLIDDDPLALESMHGLFRNWGCRVLVGLTDKAVLAGLARQQQTPDLIISDYRLADGITGIEAIERVRSEFASPIPAFLISGDIDPERLREAQERGYHLLHKPVDPMVMRAMCNQLLKAANDARSSTASETVQ